MPRVILSSIGRSGDDIFELHNLDFLETCTFVLDSRIFRKSNMFRWWYRSMRWSMRPTGEAGNLWHAPCMESWIFENFMKNWSWWTVWRSYSMKFLRWREFHCLAAPRWSITWLVERYACRVIPRRGWFCDWLVDMVMIFFGRSSATFSKPACSFSQSVFLRLEYVQVVL